MTEIVAESVRQSLAAQYAAGFTDGVGEVLDQLEGRSKRAPEGRYIGPVPLELTAWIKSVRERMP